MSEENNNNQNTNIGALWARESRNGGQKYLAGNVKFDVDGEEKTVKVVVFKNNRKERDNQPDYQIYKQREQTQEVAATASNEASPNEGSDDLL